MKDVVLWRTWYRQMNIAESLRCTYASRGHAVCEPISSFMFASLPKLEDLPPVCSRVTEISSVIYIFILGPLAVTM